MIEALIRRIYPDGGIGFSFSVRFIAVDSKTCLNHVRHPSTAVNMTVLRFHTTIPKVEGT